MVFVFVGALAVERPAASDIDPVELVTAYMDEYETMHHSTVKRTVKLDFLLRQLEVPWNLASKQFVEMPPRRRVSVSHALPECRVLKLQFSTLSVQPVT